MKVISKESKKGKQFLKMFNDSYIGGVLPYLSQVYGSYSKSKINAYIECRDWVFEYAKKCSELLNGRSWKVTDIGVISHNNFNFTFGAILEKIDDNGFYIESMYIVITKDNIYII
jgi:hypothetical protein